MKKKTNKTLWFSSVGNWFSRRLATRRAPAPAAPRRRAGPWSRRHGTAGRRPPHPRLSGCTGRSARLRIRARESDHARTRVHHTKVDSSALRIKEMRRERDPFGDADFTDHAALTDPFSVAACTAPVAFAAPACSAAASSAAAFITALTAVSLSDAAFRAASLSAIEVLSPAYRDGRTRARAAGSSRIS